MADASIRPANLDRAFILWMVIGVPTVLVLIGIVIVAAAFHLRAGYRGARVMLTALGAPSFPVPIGILHGIGAADTFLVYALLPVIGSAVVIAAVILMWRPDVSAHFRAVRSESR